MRTSQFKNNSQLSYCNLALLPDHYLYPVAKQPLFTLFRLAIAQPVKMRGSQMDRISVHGFVAAAAAYVLWGVSPLYFALVRVVPAAEILSHRIVWSVLCLLPLSLLLSGRKKLRAHLTDRKVLGPTAIASLLVSL